MSDEVGNILLLSLSNVFLEDAEYLFNDVDNMIRSGKSIEIILDVIDEKILIQGLGMSLEGCLRSKGIWDKLRKKRINSHA